MSLVHHSIIGLPSSGKTTYLAALWHILSSNEIESQFTLDTMLGDNAYLDRIAESWRECKKLDRTSLGAETDFSVNVREISTGKKAVLHFSDLSGESYDLQISSRTCTPEYVAGFEGQGGILLFVTANKATDGVSIVDMPIFEKPTEQPQASESIEWSHSHIPSQVKLVDILQFLQEIPFKNFKRKLAIMISAWDVINNATLTPDLWLEREYPLLHQFLFNNSSSFEFQVYGISAQGGSIENDISKLELAQKIPSNRIICVGPSKKSHDITSPIAWIMPVD